MLNKLLVFLFFSSLFFSCSDLKKDKVVSIDIKEIRKKGKLTVLFENSSMSYFEYRGKKMGFEYEILDTFAHFIGLPLEIKVVSNAKDFKRFLNDGEGDLIAANLAISLTDKKEINYSDPYYFTHQVLIQRSADSVIKEPMDLSHKIVFVRKNSAFDRRLHCLQEEIGERILVKSFKNDPITEDLIEMVANKEIDYTIAHENLARISKELHPNLNIKMPISFKQKIAFGIRYKSPELKKLIDSFLKDYCASTAFKELKKKYFDYIEETPTELFTLKKGQISPYDAIFKREAASRGWDWHILAAVAHKESKFNPNARGFGGAYGLMQFMPNTGPKYGVTPGASPEVQIAGGMKMLDAIYRTWKDIPNSDQRLKFTLASYNAGRCHIEDAQKLAAENGLNPKLWDENVALMVKKLAYPEYYRSGKLRCGAYRGHAVSYVNSVFARYQGWSGK
jgi:membrane-bound lytic murein transglycosylase F